MSPDWICSQLGAREHYAIPRALHRAGRLRELHTDLWSAGLWRHARFLGAPGRDLAGRFHPELDRAAVRAHPFTALPMVGAARLGRAADFAGNVFRQSLRLDRMTADRLRAPGIFFSYTGTFLESAARIQELGGRAILGQVDPAATEEEIVARERERHPGWEPGAVPPPPGWTERRRAEWDRADLVVVNSAWSRTCLEQQGVPPSKLRVVPLAYDPPTETARARIRARGAGVRVLWLGQVILRKGIACLLESARRLSALPVEFVIAGPIGISPAAVAAAPENVRFLGPISRTLVSRVYAGADLFVLPTLSDGFAITQLEAMAHGLPVIATPRCGEVVVPGQSGLIVPPGDAEALAAAIAGLVQNREALAAMALEALERSRHFGLDRLTGALLDLLPE